MRLVVIHTAEGARTVESLGRFFQGKTQASSHVGIDDHRVEQYVNYDRAAWTLRSGNPISDNAELCGFAAWDRAEWLRHPRMLELAAAWIAGRCRARGIPLRKLTPAQVAAGEPGVIGHHDWTVGKKEGSHWDPGPQFPWDLVMAKASGSPTHGGFLMALSDHDQAVLLEAANAVLLGEAGKRSAGRTALAIDEARNASLSTLGEVAGLRAAVERLAAAVGGDPVTADELKAAVRQGIAESTFRLTGAQITPTTGEDPTA
ncbi:N-acetylmuramoyl-L-alanine amidase [Crossiella sp. SN42]|uniref:peptidoglycan recognition protein family protein n=1 Tax=Crossiella sp. SN42 TaxID=2944808 RepID=UPI00207C2FB0|nr:peptidoglycan recognition family protein [Crossiella sp. SN42]MCO1575039.1 N-acetylmuramoyl-L-alanine amidase [Crossiella sp. SN42]